MSHPIFKRIVLISISSLIISAPFFLYPLFERPSLSQMHYIMVCGAALIFGIAAAVFIFPIKIFPLSPKDSPLILVGLYTAALIISAFFSGSFLFSLKEMLFLLVCMGLFAALVIAQITPADMNKILILLCAVGAVSAIYGILQNYGIEFLGYAAESKKGKLNVLSIFGHPNYLAAYLTPLLPIHINAFLNTTARLKRCLIIASSFLLAFCLALAGTRGAWLSLIMAMPVLFILRSKMKNIPFDGVKIAGNVFKTFIILAVIAILFLTLAAPRYSLRERLGDSMPLLSRFYSWRMAGEMLKDRPFLGVGYGRYKVLYWDYVNQFQMRPENRIYDYLLNYGKGVPPINVHNEFFEIAAESGIIGFALFMAFLAFVFLRGWETLANPKRQLENQILPGILAGILCILADALFNFPLHQPLSALLFWILAAFSFSFRIERAAHQK